MKNALTIEELGRTDIDAWLKEGMGDWTGDQLRAAFDLVKDSEHWKNDIDAVVDAEMKPILEKPILEKAIPFMVGGGEMHFEELPDGKLRVTASGYWSNGMDG